MFVSEYKCRRDVGLGSRRRRWLGAQCPHVTLSCYYYHQSSSVYIINFLFGQALSLVLHNTKDQTYSITPFLAFTHRGRSSQTCSGFAHPLQFTRAPINNKRQTKKRVIKTRKVTITKQQKQRPKRRQPKNQRHRMVTAPVAGSVLTVSRKPRIIASHDRSFIAHSELIASLRDADTFTIINTFPINPGLAVTFPWLSTQAVGWETYRFKSLTFRYYTRCGTGQIGSTLIIPDYNAADGPPTTETVASSYEDVAADVPWKQIVCRLNPRALQRVNAKHFIRTSTTLPPNEDVRLFDAANVYIASTDGTGGAPIGKLWVEYEVEFFTPTLPPSGGGGGGGPPGLLLPALAAFYNLEFNNHAFIPLNDGNQFDNMGSKFVRSGSTTVCTFTSPFIEPEQAYVISIFATYPSGAGSGVSWLDWSPTALTNIIGGVFPTMDNPVVSLIPQNEAFTSLNYFYTTNLANGSFGFTITDMSPSSGTIPNPDVAFFCISQINSNVLLSPAFNRGRALAQRHPRRVDSFVHVDEVKV